MIFLDTVELKVLENIYIVWLEFSATLVVFQLYRGVEYI
jgi:hypothetical protein